MTSKNVYAAYASGLVMFTAVAYWMPFSLILAGMFLVGLLVKEFKEASYSLQLEDKIKEQAAEIKKTQLAVEAIREQMQSNSNKVGMLMGTKFK